MTNPIAGHTSATAMGTNSQGLRDGDGLSSPSLTNLYEGLHGNGILRLQDTAAGDGLRNAIIAGTPGYIEIGGSQGEVIVHGGYAVVDGMLYTFANGPGSTQSFIVGDTTTPLYSGELPAAPTSTSDVYVVVYLDSQTTGHVRYEMGTPKVTSAGTPLIPNVFLSDPSAATALIHQTTVLAVLRYTMSASAGSVTLSLNSNPIINDRRAYLRTSPLYLTPMTKGSVGNVDTVNAIDAASDIDAMYTAPEGGAFGTSKLGAIWLSHNQDADGVIYADAPRGLGGVLGHDTHRLLKEVKVASLTTTETFTFDQSNIFVITGGTQNITPAGVFPNGHIVEITNEGGGTITFTGTSDTLTANQYGRFVYDGVATAWKKLLKQAVL